MLENTKSFSPHVISRILNILAYQGPMKRTTLAGKTRLNYLVMMKYINFLKSLSWIASTESNGISDVYITHTGAKFSRLISEYLKNSAQELPKQWADTVAKASLTAQSGSGTDSLYSDELTALDIREAISKANSKNKHGETRRSGANSGGQFRSDVHRVLLVDDEPDTLFTYKVFLESAGHQVGAFQDPTKALRHFVSEQDRLHYDVVVSDIRMPKINGLQLYQQIRKFDSEINFVFLTALDAAEEIVSILPDIEPFQIIRKPVQRDQLLASFDRILIMKS